MRLDSIPVSCARWGFCHPFVPAVTAVGSFRPQYPIGRPVMSGKRALQNDELSSEILCRALGVDSLTQRDLAKRLPLTRELCAQIVEHLGPFLESTSPALRALPGSIRPGAEHEIWAALDINPLLSAFDTQFRSAGGAPLEALVKQVEDSAKRLLLFAHRIVVFDYLAENASAIVTHSGQSGELEDSLEILNARATAVVRVYGALSPLFQDEVAIIGIPPSQYDADNQAFIVEHRHEMRKFSELAASSFRTRFPDNRLVKADRDFGGGIIFRGQSGATGSANFKDQKDLNVLALLLAQGLIPIRRSQPHVQPCFDDLDVAKLYNHMLAFAAEKDIRTRSDASVFMTELSTNGAIIPGALGVDDACRIREGEEIFATWRELLGETLEKVTSGELNSEDRARHFHQEVKEKEATWRGRFAAIVDHNTLIKRIIDPRQSVLTGLCAGAIHSIVTGGTDAATITVAATGAIASDVLVTAFELMADRPIRRASQALQSHFLAIGAAKT